MNTTMSSALARGGRLIAVAALIAAVLAAGLPGAASAHERRGVGEYSLLVGFMVEPAFEGEKNGVDFRVNAGDANGEPVEGLQETIQVEVTHVDSGVTRTMPLRALFGQPGRYTADFVPTAPGAYQLRFFGTLEGSEIDETFVPRSMGGGFNDVEPIADIQFPETVATGRELQGAAMGARNIALDAESAASTAQTLALAGIGVGALGVVLGIAGVVLATRRRPAPAGERERAVGDRTA